MSLLPQNSYNTNTLKHTGEQYAQTRLDRSLHVLLIECNRSERMNLSSALRQEGHEVSSAGTAEKALEIFRNEKPDIVLLDLVLQDIDGYGLARTMRTEMNDRFVPIIFITQETDSTSIRRCFEVCDDVVTKPYNRNLLMARMQAVSRFQTLYDTIQTQNDEIRFHRESILHEQDVAKKIYDRIAHREYFDDARIKRFVSPQALFNGDILLAENHPLGGLCVFLGDFTGHGLPAALGALPVVEIFYGMVRKGYAIPYVLTEMNNKLRRVLPSEVFCAAAMLLLDEKAGSCQVWMGGLPPARIRHSNKAKDTILKSTHPPLGILPKSSFQPNLEMYEVEEGDRVYLFSDGVFEAFGSEDLADSKARIEDVFRTRGEIDDIFPGIQRAILQGADTEQRDDVTFVEIEVTESTQQHHGVTENYHEQDSNKIDWEMEFSLGPHSLQTFDPLPLLLHMITETPALAKHRGQIYTILAELYSNSLEHGVLGLDSDLKSSATGFNEYYKLRQQRLEQLERGLVTFRIEHWHRDSENYLKLIVEDSGPGFDVENLQKKLESNQDFSGRGIPLVRELCESLTYADHGKRSEAVYRWS